MKEGKRPAELTWNHAPSCSVQTLSLLALVSKEDGGMEGSGKVVETGKEKLARIEK